MNDKTDFDAIVDLLDHTADRIPASAPPDWAGDYRLHYLQFVADFREVVRRAHELRGRLPATAGQGPSRTSMNPSTDIG